MCLSQKRIDFGLYVLVYVVTTNTMKISIILEIAWKASNILGGAYSMSLYTGKKLHNYIMEKLPIETDIIRWVEELSEEEKQPMMDNMHPIF